MLNLENVVQTGDLLFVHGSNWVSKAIQKITFGTVNHVGIVYDQSRMFETDLAWGKASLRELQKYNKVPIILIRCKNVNQEQIKALCKKYDATPYSFLDILNNIIFSLLKNELRVRILQVLGTKKFAICSELSARILYEITGIKELSKYEGLTPQDLLVITRSLPNYFEVVLDSISACLYPEG